MGMTPAMSHSSIGEYLQIQQSRNLRRPGREARHVLLDECVSVTGLGRKHLIKALWQASAGRRRRGRGALAYGLIAASKPEPTAPTSYPALREFVLPRVAPIEPPSIQQK